MGRKRTSGIPRNMRAGDWINTNNGIDRGSNNELYREHIKSQERGLPVPVTLNTGKDIISTPRGKADLRAFEERTATSSLTTRDDISERIAIVKTWNYFRIDGKLTLHFKMREWVFLKVIDKGLMISTPYLSKDLALMAKGAKNIFWAGEMYI